MPSLLWTIFFLQSQRPPNPQNQLPMQQLEDVEEQNHLENSYQNRDTPLWIYPQEMGVAVESRRLDHIGYQMWRGALTEGGSILIRTKDYLKLTQKNAPQAKVVHLRQVSACNLVYTTFFSMYASRVSSKNKVFGGEVFRNCTEWSTLWLFGGYGSLNFAS